MLHASPDNEQRPDDESEHKHPACYGLEDLIELAYTPYITLWSGNGMITRSVWCDIRQRREWEQE